MGGLLAIYRLKEMHCHKVDEVENRDGAVMTALSSHQRGPARFDSSSVPCVS